MKRTWRAGAAIAVIILGFMPAAARAGFSDWNGHLGIGYAKLFPRVHDISQRGLRVAPAGSLSMSAGLDYPITSTLRSGVDIGYHLLGSHSLVRGSQFANVDYSVFDVALLAHWTPPAGPIARLSAGPDLFSAHGDLSTTGGGAGFSDLPVAETAFGFALDATVMQRSAAPVKVGLEIGTRVGFLEDETWILAIARFVFHY